MLKNKLAEPIDLPVWAIKTEFYIAEHLLYSTNK